MYTLTSVPATTGRHLEDYAAAQNRFWAEQEDWFGLKASEKYLIPVGQPGGEARPTDLMTMPGLKSDEPPAAIESIPEERLAPFVAVALAERQALKEKLARERAVRDAAEAAARARVSRLSTTVPTAAPRLPETQSNPLLPGVGPGSAGPGSLPTDGGINPQSALAKTSGESSRASPPSPTPNPPLASTASEPMSEETALLSPPSHQPYLPVAEERWPKPQGP